MLLSELKEGQLFKLAGYKWVVLEHNPNNQSTLVVTKECVGRKRFDKDGSNDFRNSSIRKYLNIDFLNGLIAEGLDRDNIMFTDFDLTNDEGKNVYGFCRDRIGLLTLEQYKKYKRYLRLDDWLWLITPISGSSYGVRYVLTSGSLGGSNAFDGNFGVLPALNLKSDILVSENKNTVLESYSNEELLQELLRREVKR